MGIIAFPIRAFYLVGHDDTDSGPSAYEIGFKPFLKRKERAPGKYWGWQKKNPGAP